MIQRGYDRRNLQLWSAIRWQTFRLMEASVGTESMKDAGLNTPKDLMSFPWEIEKKDQTSITDESYDEIQRMIVETNEKIKRGAVIF
mgnify:CR=1 FL=1